MYQLRDYQVIAVKEGLEVMSSKTPCKDILVLPTGAGKSLIIAKIAEQLDGNILIIVPSKELLSQNLEKFEAIGGKASIYSASFNSKVVSKITFATIGSLKVNDFIDKDIKYVIQDECQLHSQAGSKLSSFLRGIKINNLLGLTATPMYLKTSLEGSQLKIMTRVKGKLYNKIAHVTQIKELVENNYWSKLEYEVVDVDNKSLKFNTTGSDYTLKSMIINYQDNNIARKIKLRLENLKDRKSILVFVPTIEDAEKLSKMISGSKVVHSKVSAKERDEIINSFKELKHRVTINVNVLGVGFDHPELDCIITARPTTSINMYYQQIGRGCRIHALKKNCLIIDFSGNVSKFGPLEELNYENIDGWGLFNKDVLLTNVPMWSDKKITKSTIRANLKAKLKSIPEPVEPIPSKISFWFGKHKGKTADQIIKDNDVGYLKWIIQNTEFDWSSTPKKILKKSIENSLNMDTEKPVTFTKSENSKTLKEIYENHIRKLTFDNLNTLF
jgi:DNA repair protein RadD